MLFHIDLNIYAFVGLIMLVGIVKKNAIMMIDFAIDAQRRGQSAGRRHLPGLPAALPSDHDDHDGRADGDIAHRARVRAPAASRGGRSGWRSSGLIVSQLLTLYITPVIYLYMESFQNWVRRHLPRRHEESPSTAAPSAA